MQHFIFISARRSDVAESVNTENYLNLGLILRAQFGDANVTPCLGSYKGEQEESFRVDITDLEYPENMLAADFIDSIALAYRQESVLHVRDNEARLHFTGEYDIYERQIKGNLGHVLYIGRWTEIERDLVDGEDAWTFINGRYWTAS